MGRLDRDGSWRRRAAAVIPGGMYGHQSVGRLPDGYPQFMARGEGARVWDVDGNEYVDLMCSYGPVVLGHRHPRVEEAARRQAAEADCQNGPSTLMVELAERLVDVVDHADWVLLSKNGTDATTQCVTIARAGTGRRKVLVARGSYHGAAPWCTPIPAGVTAEDRAHLFHYDYNDLTSAEAAAAEAGDDLAAVLVTPIRHDLGIAQELPDPDFARGLRALCDRTGAALILDDVRCGLRLNLGSSWEPIGVRPDLSAWSKAIANGHALAAAVGSAAWAEAAASIFTTGSFWFSAVSMAASLATLDVMAEEDSVGRMVKAGTALREGLAAQASGHGLDVVLSGPVQMPLLGFVGDDDWGMADRFAQSAILGGLYLHPRHNWFVSAAMDDEDVARALEVTDRAFASVAEVAGS